MAVSASAVKAGKAFVEVGANDAELQKVLKRAEKSVKAFGESVAAAGKSLVALGAAVAAPLALGAKSFATYEDALAALRSAANPTEKDLVKIENAIARISTSTGAGPTMVTQAMGELLKANVELEDALGGVTEAAVKFAKVAGVDAETAAVTLADTMKVFKVDVTTAMDTLSRAADASSTSLSQIIQSFQQVSAVSTGTGFSLEETAAAVSIMGNNSIKASDAGTSLKTMFLRLRRPVDEAAKAVDLYKINVRNAEKEMLPLQDIVAELNKKLGGLNDEAKQKALGDLFGTDAVRGAEILMNTGAKGIEEFTSKMRGGLAVTAKYDIVMNTLSGAVQRAKAGLESLGIVIGATLAPAINEAAKMFTGFLSGLVEIADHNQGLIKTFAAAAVGIAALGAAMITAGIAMKAAAFTLGILGLLMTGISLAVKGAAIVWKALSVSIVLTDLAVKATALSTSALGAAFALVTSPLAIITAGFAGLAVLAYQLTDGFRAVGEAASSIFGEIASGAVSTFSDMKETALAAFGGIAEALKSGDISKAGAILWQALEVEWLEGTGFLSKVWSDWSIAATEVFKSFSFQIASLMTDASSAIQKAWITAFGIIERVINEVGAVAMRAWAIIQSVIGGADLDEELAKVEKKLAELNAAADAKTGAGVGAVEADRQAAQKALEDQQTAEVEARRKRAADALAKDQAALAQAKADLNKLLAPTPEAAGEGGAAGALGDIQAELGKAPGKKAGTGTEPPDKDKDKLDDIGKGVEAAARKVDVKGTFSAMGAGQSLATGDTASSKLEEIKKKHDATIEQLKKLNEKAKEGKLVFAS